MWSRIPTRTLGGSWVEVELNVGRPRPPCAARRSVLDYGEGGLGPWGGLWCCGFARKLSPSQTHIGESERTILHIETRLE